jgi:hypothetical protein
MLKQLSLAEGSGPELWCQEQIIPGSGMKIHRWCGYAYRCEVVGHSKNAHFPSEEKMTLPLNTAQKIMNSLSQDMKCTIDWIFPYLMQILCVYGPMGDKF